MKKLFLILSTISLASVPVLTVTSCRSKADDESSKLPKNANNSLVNLQGGAAILAKKTILEDQYGLSAKTLQTAIAPIKAHDETKKNTNGDFDENDFGLTKNSNVNQLQSQYFTGISNEVVAAGKININGKIGSGNDEIWNKLGVTDGELISMVDMAINLLTTTKAKDIVSSISGILPMVDEQFKKIIENIDVENIKTTVKGIFENDEVVTRLDQELSDASLKLEDYSHIPVDNLLSIFLIQFGNGLGKILDPEYQVVPMVANKPDQKKWRSEFKKTIEEVYGQIAKKLLAPTTLSHEQTPDLTVVIDQYVSGAVFLVQSFQTLTLHLSLFDEYWAFAPKDSKHLFSEEKTSKEIMQKVLLSGPGNQQGRTFEDAFAKHPHLDNINLQYLLSLINNVLNVEKIDGDNYQLQKFLTVLLTTPFEIEVGKLGKSDSQEKMNPLYSAISSVMVQLVLSQMPKTHGEKGFHSFLKLFIDPHDAIDIVVKNFVSQFSITLLGGSVEALLANTSIEPVIMELIDQVYSFLNMLKIVKQIDQLPQEIRGVVKLLINKENKPIFLKSFFPELIKSIPLLGSETPWAELNSGDPLDLTSLITAAPRLTAVLNKMEAEGEELDGRQQLEKLLDPRSLRNWDSKIKGLLPAGRKVNVQNLLTTELKKIIKPVLPQELGGYYLEKSVSQIVTEFSAATNTEQLHKIFDHEMTKVNFKVSLIKDLFDKVKDYDYKVSDLPDDRLKNLILLILENPGSLSKILGKIEDNNKWGEGSILDFIFKDLFKIDSNKTDDGKQYEPWELTMSAINDIYQSLNNPSKKFPKTHQDTMVGLYNSDDSEFKFTFSSFENDPNTTPILSQKLTVNFTNLSDKSKWVYTFSYSRENVMKKFSVETVTKQKILN